MKNLRLTNVLALMLALMFTAFWVGKASAESLDLTWEHPTEREPEVPGGPNPPLPLEEIAGYELSWGRCGEDMQALDAGKVTAYSIPLPDPAYGKWCVDARTVDTSGLKSEPASVLREIKSPPLPPRLFTVDSVAYELRIHPQKGLVAGRAVGWVPTGAECYADSNGMPFVEPDLYGIHSSFVAFTKEPKSELLVAKCAPADGQG